MPVVNASAIVRVGRIALGHGISQGSAGRIGHIAGDDLAAQISQIGLVAPLVGDKQHIGPVERIDGLNGDVLGIASPDTHDENGFHARFLPDGQVLDKRSRAIYSNALYYTIGLNGSCRTPLARHSPRWPIPPAGPFWRGSRRVKPASTSWPRRSTSPWPPCPGTSRCLRARGWSVAARRHNGGPAS